MKNFLTTLFVLMSFNVFSQSKVFDNLTAYLSVPYGVGAEIGKNPSKDFGYFFGFSSDLIKQDNGVDLLLYAKGVYPITKNFGISGFAGFENFDKIVLGLGARAMVPVNKHKLLLEPTLRTNGSRINVGYIFKL